MNLFENIFRRGLYDKWPMQIAAYRMRTERIQMLTQSFVYTVCLRVR